MIPYSKKNINLIAISISVVLLIIVNLTIFYFQENSKKSISQLQYPTQTIYSATIEAPQGNLVQDSWRLEIPKINLVAPITQGIDYKNMETSICHFEESAMKDGNVALAAHNRGYTYNFFERLKELEIGDTICYVVDGKNVTYQVEANVIISDRDWSYVKNTKEDKITLITCVENEPSYRRCVQAIKI